MKQQVNIGTRGSKLALAQTNEITAMLHIFYPELDFRVVVVRTEGDSDRISPLPSFGGRGAFVKRIEQALENHEIDLAVHSLKDLPSTLPDGLVLGAVPVREDPRDALVSGDGSVLDILPEKSSLATGSLRRKAQIQMLRSDLIFTDIRGNVETRLKKLERGGIDGVILASAGLKRLGFENKISQYFDPEVVVPAPSQGALGVECRSDDKEILKLVEKINNPDVSVCVEAERVFIAELGMGCHMPVGAFAQREGDIITFHAFVSDGKGIVVRETLTAPETSIQREVCILAQRIRSTIYHEV